MSREYNIPESWIKTSIEDVILYQKGKKPKILEPIEFENSVPYLDIKAFEKKEIRQYADKESSQIIDEQDVVMVWDGARSGLVSKGVNGALGSTIARFRPFLFSQKFLYYFLDSQFSYINSNTKGTGIPHVDPQILWSIKFPLPPLNEQNRIVSKIEELFSELDNGVSNLKLVQNQLKVYRQALLKHAFEGKLTEQWRKENNPEPAEKLLERIKEERQQRFEQELKEWKIAVKAWENDGKKGRKPKKPRELDSTVKESNSKKITVPSKWVITKVADIYSSLTDYHSNGSYKSLKKVVQLYDDKNFALMIRATNFEKSDFANDVKYIDENAYNFLSKSKLFGEELLIGKIGNAGKVYFMPKLNRPASLAMNLFSLSFEGLDNKFVYRQMISPRLSKEIESHVKGVGNPTIDKISIRSLNIVLPSIEEQHEINLILDSQFSIIDNLEQTIESGLKKSEALRQSILKKAFEGKLVHQDPNDEPASELLKCILAEKKKYLEEQKQQKKIKPKNTKKMSKELSIEEVLKTSEKPMLAKDVWQKSKHKENIEDFYKELKDIQSKIKEVKKGTESLLSLAK